MVVWVYRVFKPNFLLQLIYQLISRPWEFEKDVHGQSLLIDCQLLLIFPAILGNGLSVGLLQTARR